MPGWWCSCAEQLAEEVARVRASQNLEAARARRVSDRSIKCPVLKLALGCLDRGGGLLRRTGRRASEGSGASTQARQDSVVCSQPVGGVLWGRVVVYNTHTAQRQRGLNAPSRRSTQAVTPVGRLRRCAASFQDGQPCTTQPPAPTSPSHSCASLHHSIRADHACRRRAAHAEQRARYVRPRRILRPKNAASSRLPASPAWLII